VAENAGLPLTETSAAWAGSPEDLGRTLSEKMWRTLDWSEMKRMHLHTAEAAGVNVWSNVSLTRY